MLLQNQKFQMDFFYYNKEEKRKKGQYFTASNPFSNPAFYEWSNKFNIQNINILEPFAGSNNLILMLKEINLCNEFISYDIEPKHKDVEKRDTLLSFPEGFEVCITNPPYLARNSAKRRGLDFPECEYDDLYKLSLKKCLDNCSFVGAIIPASFLNSKLFRDRLSYYILLNTKMFQDTEHPVCLALFEPKSSNIAIYNDTNFVGNLTDLEKKLPNPNRFSEMHFNDKMGELGLFAIDNTAGPSIQFCDGDKISSNRISSSSRSITRIGVDYPNIAKLIKNLNEYLQDFRQETCDIFLTPFKGLRRDGAYRRRLDYDLARSIINQVICKI